MMARHRLMARLAPHSLRVSAERRGGEPWSAALHFEAETDLTEAMASLATAIARERLPRRLMVVVELPLVQRRLLTDLPPVRQAELNRLVARAAPRFFRQNGHPLVSAAVWDEASSPARRLATAVALDGILAEAIVAGAERAGLRLEDILPDGGNPDLSLLPRAEHERRRRSGWQGLTRLAALVALLWLVVIALARLQLRLETRQVEAELVRLQPPRQALVGARQAMDSAGDLLTALDLAEAGRTRLATRLAALVRALPDSTFLTALTLDTAGVGRASGRTQGVGRLVSALEAAPGLGTVRLEGATVRDTIAGGVWERFSLQLGRKRAP
jgi:hypothetical protein